jgi:hypothetical protein
VKLWFLKFLGKTGRFLTISIYAPNIAGGQDPRHPRPNLIYGIMGVQQRSGGIAHRLRSGQWFVWEPRLMLSCVPLWRSNAFLYPLWNSTSSHPIRSMAW